jgi:hypothetical protein
MKTLSGPKRQVGLTRLEVLVIVGVVLIGGVVLVPKWIKSKEGSKLAHCPRNLKQLGMSEKSWLLDRGGRFPWQTPASEGGSMQYAASADVFRHFQAISNEFETPKFLVCPSDASRTVASSFDRGFSNSNISYFAGLDADERNPYSVVHGDRNITGGVPTSFGLSFPFDQSASVGKRQHASGRR